MHPTFRLLTKTLPCQITLFTRPNCSLCVNAKTVLSSVWDKRPFEYREIDVMEEKGKEWRGFYEFDTPVIHVSKAAEGEERTEVVGKAKKLMHRFTAEEVEAKMNEVEKS